ncbi:TPA: hypothetical protein DIU27_05670 [Candidatus Collierbacteria bacterium]|uniref:Methyltransferase type 11 domain-containing protein n=1 Tax=Candidatus Collierbacteria bacterium GW2011_GWB2_44_22 TaxID=1618387 RepID=A0A0G1KT21_9BACT|nr:MAG: hypothetical protein UW31_C0018G0007 [Candidatus Collierbacteria bacterium GW2011_GWA2_44_13]KKT51054.1 MAG: hypothetical protein UW44_C0017G0004 [Candidatus Collierbacteria bacterium GW2011_GWB2_44_22]KKT62068.1 MAG: hypothetical protein UW56_C0012G0007 [Candidatus Collierbacteria bacterium GW2011_GWD1_44_27]KKT64602.1 MAG: hypothetical protein UW58_C0039G0001 [Candidatus Collierbacteria bacterium GW2011_GWC2_44_30]KKT68427.1 MAG: hypothetical protein UW64_C0019G0004 [Microgenomates gr
METTTVFLTGQESGLVETVNVALELQKILDSRHTNPYGKRVMELGFGEETLMPFLFNKFGEKVSRMDLGDWNQRNRKVNAGLVQGELQCLPISGNSVDVVVSVNIFEEEFDLARALGEIERVLIGGGESLLIISGEHFQDGKLKLETALEIVGSSVITSPAGMCDSWVITLKKK